MLHEMKMMGFFQDMALYALKSVQYHSKDRAVDFLMEIGPDEKYQHPYIQGNSGCFICQKGIEFHLSSDTDEDDLNNVFQNVAEVENQDPIFPISLELKLNKFKSMQELSLRISQKLVYDLNLQDAKFPLCSICYNGYQPGASYKFGCGHEFCLDCTKEHLKYQISRA